MNSIANKYKKFDNIEKDIENNIYEYDDAVKIEFCDKSYK